jgi:RNA polymerase sigma-70 factor (ECF subfamily)
MPALIDLVTRARSGDLDAFGRLVAMTQTMAYAVARRVLHEPQLAEDAAQEAYLRAFRRLGDLEEPGGFIPWLRRIVITSALNLRRARRTTWLRLDDAPEVPVLDEKETAWSEAQRRQLARALLTLTPDERRLCDRRYHGRWSTARLAQEAGVDEATIRKRLQRVRDKLRKEIEVSEQKTIGPNEMRPQFSEKVVELLGRPRLIDLPENPVGKVLDLIRQVYGDWSWIELPEMVDFAEAERTVGSVALYIGRDELHRVDDRRILRYDLTLPLLMTVRYEGKPLKVWTAGKTYRIAPIDAMHLDAFHQAEAFWLERRDRVDPWQMTTQVLRSLDAVLPGRAVKIVPTQYPMCTQAWELEVEDGGHWFEVLAWGVFTDEIVRHVGGDPAIYTAMGAGYGLERLAMVRYGIDDIRKVDVARVA